MKASEGEVNEMGDSSANQIDFTTVVAVDDAHLKQLRLTWPTWTRFRHQISKQPLIIICDGERPLKEWQSLLSFVQHPQLRLVSWSQSGVTQREKMLTALTLIPGREVQTPWYLKIDTDVVASASDCWIQSNWFTPDEKGREPAFISSPWGYTKPPDAIDILDDWGETQPELAHLPRLNLHPNPGATLVSHQRTASWVFWGNTNWTRTVTANVQQRLPVPSQDTYLWYCAARRQDFFRLVKMRSCGWNNYAQERNLRRACEESLAAPHSGESGDVIAQTSLPAKVRTHSKEQLSIYVSRQDASPLAELVDPFLRSYAGKWGYEVKLIPEAHSKIHPIWQKFLLPMQLDEEFMLILDENLCPLPGAGPIHKHLKFDRLNLTPALFSRTGRESLPPSPLPIQYLKYDSGLMGVPRTVSERLNKLYQRFETETFLTPESLELNIWIWQSGMLIHQMDRCWNSPWKLGKEPDEFAKIIRISGRPSRQVERATRLRQHYHSALASLNDTEIS